MDKESFITQAMNDLVQPNKSAVSESTKPDAIVDMAMEDLTGQKSQTVQEADVKPVDRSNLNLEDAFNKSVSGQNDLINEDEAEKDTIAQDIAEAGADVLEKMLKGLR